MGSEKTKKRIDAGIALSSDSNANILCPECEKTNLSVKDIMDESLSVILERMIYCDVCGSQNYIRLNKRVKTEENGSEG